MVQIIGWFTVCLGPTAPRPTVGGVVAASSYRGEVEQSVQGTASGEAGWQRLTLRQIAKSCFFHLCSTMLGPRGLGAWEAAMADETEPTQHCLKSH